MCPKSETATYYVQAITLQHCLEITYYHVLPSSIARLWYLLFEMPVELWITFQGVQAASPEWLWSRTQAWTNVQRSILEYKDPDSR